MEIQNNVSQILESMQSVIDNISMSLLLGILGIAITIFTVIYSFMETAKQRKRELSDRTALLTETDPVLQSDLHFTIGYLKRLKRMNMAIFIIIIVDIVTFAIFSIHMLLKESCPLWYVSIVLESLFIVGCLIVLIVYFCQYFKRFRHV